MSYNPANDETAYGRGLKAGHDSATRTVCNTIKRLANAACTMDTIVEAADIFLRDLEDES